MPATDILKDEHRGIERMLAVLEKAADRLADGQDVSPEIFVNGVDFFRNFTDGCHHAKEETQLFPALERAGMPTEGGPVGVMLMEHNEGRQYIRDLDAAAKRYAGGDMSAKRAIIAAVRGYAALLSAHIQKEDTILFPMAESMLPDTEHKRLVGAFDDIESHKMGPGVHERYHHMIDEYEELAKSW